MKLKVNPCLILLFHVLILILFHLFGYTGHFGYDDIHYADLANSLNQGHINFDDHASFRFPVLFFTALAYRIFGVNDFASALPAMFMAVSVLVLVFFVLKNKGIEILFLGLSITALTPWFLFYSDKLMPDFYVVFSIMLALFIIYRYKYESNKKHPWLYALLLAFSLLFGFMAKGTIVLLIPLLLYVFVTDLLKKRDVRFWLYALLNGLFLLSIYFFVIGWLTGDVAKRFHAITQNSYLNLCSYDQQPIEFLIRRITYEFFDMMIYQYMVVGLVFVVSAFFSKKIKYFFQLNDPFSFFLISTLLLLLSSNFMTISFRSYVPMCLDPRHFLFLIPIAAIPAAEIISHFIRYKKQAVSIVILFSVLAILSFFFHRLPFWDVYLPLLLLVIGSLFIKNKTFLTPLFLFLFIGILFIKPARMVQSAIHFKYRQQKEFVFKHILTSKTPCLVITNDVQKRLGRYFTAFNENSMVEFVNYNEFVPDSGDQRQKLLLLSYHTRAMTNQSIDDLPYYARNICADNPLVFENKDLGMAIYQLNSIEIPELTGAQLINSLNNFEGPFNYWGYCETSNQVAANGKYAGKVGLYSSTLALAIDSLNIHSYTRLVVTTSVKCFFKEKANCSLVVSLENNEGTYEWKGLDVEPFIKAYAHWWPVKYEQTFNVNLIKSASVLKVYIFNENENEVYIDDFEVKVIGLN